MPIMLIYIESTYSQQSSDKLFDLRLLGYNFPTRGAITANLFFFLFLAPQFNLKIRYVACNKRILLIRRLFSRSILLLLWVQTSTSTDLTRVLHGRKRKSNVNQT